MASDMDRHARRSPHWRTKSGSRRSNRARCAGGGRAEGPNFASSDLRTKRSKA